MEDKEMKKYRPSQFSYCVKVKKNQLLWLKETKDCKTISGYLDKIINNFKKYGYEGVPKVPREQLDI